MDIEKLPITLIDSDSVPILLSSSKSRSRSSIRSNSRSKSTSRSRSRDSHLLINRNHRLSLVNITDIVLPLPSIISGPSTPISETLPSNLLPSPFFPPTLAGKLDLGSNYLTPALPDSYPSLPKRILPKIMDEKDKGTPDEWILRDEKLVRLTGRWPFNCEAPLTNLFDAGFITPTDLFYVRNHGVVPQVSLTEAINWELEISGLVANPITLKLSDLLDPLQFSPVTLPITLVCAGNRRKEQNVFRQSLGFSWGPAGLSTALFTGVYLADILERVCPQTMEGKDGEGSKRPQHVIFEGAEDLPDGKYGTSQLLRWAKNKEKGMMIAWAMNGEALEPDHGFPLRLVVPGQIGGRSVKWIKKIIVSDKESQHHLHFWDNKVLPTTLMPEQARVEREWWYDPRYIINDLNTNSAIAKPAHDEFLTVLPIPTSALDSELVVPVQTYTLRGYAYGGGGRRINRVEITLNAGQSWILAEISYPEDLYRKQAFKSEVWGTIDLTERDESYCWAFWECKVDVADLVEAGSVAVRASDQGLNLQGQSMYWNPTGMMNNWWFRVAIHKTVIEGITTIQFEHPTMPGTQPGGWMDRMKQLDLDILNPIFTDAPSAEDQEILLQSKNSAKKPDVVMIKEGVNRMITMEELEAHDKEDEPWFVVHGEVYDGTAFLSSHPGGSESITIVAGQDATEDFLAIHSPDAKAKLARFHIGTLIISTEKVETITVVETTIPDATFLQKTKWKSAELVSIQLINHDSRLYRFELETPDQDLGLPTGQHVYARLRRKVCPADAESTRGEPIGEMVQRAYTPVSPSNAKGFLELLIKVYHRTSDFPEGGKMTLGFEELEVGDSVEFKGPLGSFQWLGKGMAKWRGVELKAKNIGMICAGSGITPIIQVLKGVIHDVEDTDTRLWLLNANKTEADILLRQELIDLENHVGPTRFQHHHCLSKAPEDWQHSRGRINQLMLEMHLPPPGPESLVLYCGPDPMVETVKVSLAALGWDVEKTLVIF